MWLTSLFFDTLFSLFLACLLSFSPAFLSFSSYHFFLSFVSLSLSLSLSFFRLSLS